MKEYRSINKITRLSEHPKKGLNYQLYKEELFKDCR